MCSKFKLVDSYLLICRLTNDLSNDKLYLSKDKFLGPVYSHFAKSFSSLLLEKSLNLTNSDDFIFFSTKPTLVPPLVPPTIGNTSRYNVRNINDLQTLHANTQCYFNSFSPSVIRDWNELSQPIRNSTSLSSFYKVSYRKQKF